MKRSFWCKTCDTVCIESTSNIDLCVKCRTKFGIIEKYCSNSIDKILNHISLEDLQYKLDDMLHDIKLDEKYK